MPASSDCLPPGRSLWRRALFAVLVAGVVTASITGCAGDLADEPEVGDTEDAILGGKVENGWPAVGMLRWRTAFGSAALISPTMVLTAAHVAAGNPTEFLYGSPAAGKTPRPENLRAVAVAEIIIHPCYNTPKAAGCPGDPIDVALVRLAQPITDVTPIKVIDVPLERWWGLSSPYEGDTCVAVGFGGFISADKKVTSGTRRSALSTIRSVDSTELVTVRATGIATSGDSGGPLVCGNRIVGTVRGSAIGVPKTAPFERIREGYERTDLWRDWIARGGKGR